jgi:hypothetical protein
MKTRVKEAVGGVEPPKKTWVKTDRDTKPGGYGYGKEKKARTFAAMEGRCPVCSENHDAGYCPKFKKVSLSNRWRTVKQKGLCKVCLIQGHMASDCPKTSSKDGERVPNHRLLQRDWDTTPNKTSSSQPQKQSTATKTLPPKKQEDKPTQKGRENKPTPKGSDQVLVNMRGRISLRTVPVMLRHKQRIIHTNAMLHDGSSESYLLEDMAHQLNLPVLETSKRVSLVFGDRVEEYHTMRVEGLAIQGVEQEEEFEIDSICLVLVGEAPIVDWDKAARDWERLTRGPFPVKPRGKKIGVLIGNRHAYLHCSLKEIAAEDDIKQSDGHGSKNSAKFRVLLPLFQWRHLA